MTFRLVRKVSQPIQPEFFLLLGIDVFLAISLLSCLFDKHFPVALPYVYQVAALAGFGHLLVSKEFLSFFDGYMRFWYSIIYLSVALFNVAALNVYLAFVKRLWVLAKAFLLAVTFPSFLASSFFVFSYSSVATHSFFVVPFVPMEFVFLGVVGFDTFVVGLGIYLFLKPRWYYIAIPGGLIVAVASVFAALKPSLSDASVIGSGGFVVLAVVLGVACVIVLGASIYVLLRLWKEKHERR